MSDGVEPASGDEAKHRSNGDGKLGFGSRHPFELSLPAHPVVHEKVTASTGVRFKSKADPLLH